MSLPILVFVLLALSVAGFVLGRGKAIASAGGDARNLHSLPNYYGWFGFLVALLPASLVLLLWLPAQSVVIENQVSR